jgi:hypothetical protein
VKLVTDSFDLAPKPAPMRVNHMHVTGCGMTLHCDGCHTSQPIRTSGTLGDMMTDVRRWHRRHAECVT